MVNLNRPEKRNAFTLEHPSDIDGIFVEFRRIPRFG